MNTRHTLINYLKAKVNEQDWHAVSDAANDLRVLEATPETAFTPEEKRAKEIVKEIIAYLNKIF